MDKYQVYVLGKDDAGRYDEYHDFDSCTDAETCYIMLKNWCDRSRIKYIAVLRPNREEWMRWDNPKFTWD